MGSAAWVGLMNPQGIPQDIDMLHLIVFTIEERAAY